MKDVDLGDDTEQTIRAAAGRGLVLTLKPWGPWAGLLLLEP